MSLEWEQVLVDAVDPVAVGRWWADVLGWVVVNDDPDEFEIRPSQHRLPGLLFALVTEARRVDIGQGTVPWVVLADPEGNEFCVLSAPTT